jgi:hypothetical protein
MDWRNIRRLTSRIGMNSRPFCVAEDLVGWRPGRGETWLAGDLARWRAGEWYPRGCQFAKRIKFSVTIKFSVRNGGLRRSQAARPVDQCFKASKSVSRIFLPFDRRGMRDDPCGIRHNTH